MPPEQRVIMDALRDKPPAAWLEYLRPFEAGALPTGLCMFAIYMYAGHLATEQNSLDWAEVAVRAAEVEARNNIGFARMLSLLTAMSIRAKSIAKFGSRPNHPVLDKDTVTRWVRQTLPDSPQAIREMRKRLSENAERGNYLGEEERKQMTSDFGTLLWLRRRLSVAKLLAECGELPEDPVLNEWLDISAKLFGLLRSG